MLLAFAFMTQKFKSALVVAHAQNEVLHHAVQLPELSWQIVVVNEVDF